MNPACLRIRKNILSVSRASGHGHIPTCFSVVEILHAVYETIRHDPGNPAWKDRDLLLLSKGHGALAHYCVLAEQGYFPIDRLYSFGGFQSDFGCHADRLKVPGIEASTGSLGHGIGLAVGMAIAAKIRGTDRRVYVIVGDGECNEGSAWEAVMVAVSRKLENLTILYDNNRSHLRGLQIQNPVGIFTAFGCNAFEVDGHDVTALANILPDKSSTVRAVVANTKKGFGCPTLVENQYEWHRKSPNEREYEILMRELDAQAI